MQAIKNPARSEAGDRVGSRLSDVVTTRASAAEDVVLRGGAATSCKVGSTDLAVFTPDTPNLHKGSTTAGGSQLIDGEFGVGHCSVFIDGTEQQGCH